MDPDRHEGITTLLLEACKRDLAERSRFLDEARGDEAELDAEVESLLANDRGAGAISPRTTNEGLTVSVPPGDHRGLRVSTLGTTPEFSGKVLLNDLTRAFLQRPGREGGCLS